MNPVGNFALVERIVPVLAICLALAACGTSGGDLAEKGPMATPQVVTVIEGVPPSAGEKGPRNTGAYPGFERPLTSAALQMTDDEAVSQEARLSALGKARKSGSISEAEYQRRAKALRDLAAQHGQQTMDEIAN